MSDTRTETDESAVSGGTAEGGTEPDAETTSETEPDAEMTSEASGGNRRWLRVALVAVVLVAVVVFVLRRRDIEFETPV